MNIHVPSVPGHLRITQTMVEDLLYDPVMGVWVFFRRKLDVFQQCRLKYFWFGQDVEDSSGFSSGKTVIGYFWIALRMILLPDNIGMVMYPTFQQGKNNFWPYLNTFATPLFRAQLGKVDFVGEEDGKANSKEPACWKQHFKNGSQIWMPAPNFLNEARSLSGFRTNTQLIDEYNKILATAGGEEGMRKQILGRNTRASFNKDHPIWCNKYVKLSTAEMSDHPAYGAHKRHMEQVRKGNPGKLYVSWCYKDYSNVSM